MNPQHKKRGTRIHLDLENVYGDGVTQSATTAVEPQEGSTCDYRKRAEHTDAADTGSRSASATILGRGEPIPFSIVQIGDDSRGRVATDRCGRGAQCGSVGERYCDLAPAECFVSVTRVSPGLMAAQWAGRFFRDRVLPEVSQPQVVRAALADRRGCGHLAAGSFLSLRGSPREPSVARSTGSVDCSPRVPTGD